MFTIVKILKIKPKQCWKDDFMLQTRPWQWKQPSCLWGVAHCCKRTLAVILIAYLLHRSLQVRRTSWIFHKRWGVSVQKSAKLNLSEWLTAHFQNRESSFLVIQQFSKSYCQKGWESTTEIRLIYVNYTLLQKVSDLTTSITWKWRCLWL